MLGEMPQMLRDLLADALAHETDMELTLDSETGTDGDEDATPDVVLIGTTSVEQSAAALLARWPNARVIAIEQHGRGASMYELRPYRVELGELSPAGVVDSIRAAVRGAAHAGNRPACSL